MKKDRNSVEKKEIYDSMLEEVSEHIEEQQSIEEKIELLYDSGLLKADFDGDYEDIESELTYKSACQRAIDKLLPENLLITKEGLCVLDLMMQY